MLRLLSLPSWCDVMHRVDGGSALCSVWNAMCRYKLSKARLALCKGRLYRRIDAGDGRLLVVADIRAIAAFVVVATTVAAAVVAVGGDGLLCKCRECEEVSSLQRAFHTSARLGQ